MKKLYISTAMVLMTAFVTPAIAQEEKMQDLVSSPVAVDTSVLDRTAVKRHYDRKPFADAPIKSVNPDNAVLETVPTEQNVAVTADPETEVSEKKQPVTMQPIISEGDNGPTAIQAAEKAATEAWGNVLPEKKPTEQDQVKAEPGTVVEAEVEGPGSVEGDMLQYRDAPIIGVEDSNAEEVIDIITPPTESSEVIPEQHRVLADSLPKPSLAVPDAEDVLSETPVVEAPAVEAPQDVAVQAAETVVQAPAVIEDTNVIPTTPDQLPAELKKELDMEMKKTYQAAVPSEMLKENKPAEKTLSIRPSAKPEKVVKAVEEEAKALPEVVAPALETTQVPDVPEAAETKETVDNTAMSLMFDGNESDVTQDMKQKLDAILQRLKGNKSMRVQLHAFATGQDGNPSSARRISLARALSVREYLVDQGGLRPTRMDVRALGDQTQQQPVDRIDFVFVQ